jgi:hypothetical protein
VFRGEVLERDDRVLVLERRGLAGDLAALLVQLLGTAGHLLGALRDEVLRERARHRLSRVLGIGVDLAARQGLVDDLRRPDVVLDVDLVALGFKALGVELAEDVLLGEVLGADRERRFAFAGRRRASRPAASAARPTFAYVQSPSRSPPP